MGNICTGDSPPQIPQQITIHSHSSYQDLSLKSPSLSIRMGEVEKLRSCNLYQPNRFLFILPLKQTAQLCKIQCQVISSYSHHLSLSIPILGGPNKVRMDTTSCPIIDRHDLESDRQIMHKFAAMEPGNQSRCYTVKAYPFASNHHDIFKNGLYEAYLYQCVQAYTRVPILKQFFLLEKGAPSSLVFIFGSYLSSLEDILIHRKQYNMPYTQDEQLFICNQILNKYKILLENNIVHRDLRASKIYLADTLESVKGLAPNILGYELLNLESARKLSATEMRMQEYQDDGRLLMSIRGVPIYSSPDLLNYHLQHQQIGMYNPWHNDRIQLAKMLGMIVSLQTNSQDINYEQINRKNKDIFNLIKNLENFTIPIKNIIRNFHDNHSSKLPFVIGILRSDYNIIKTNLSKQMQLQNKQRIDRSTTQLLYILHQEQLLKQRIGNIINNNFEDRRSYNNVAVLNRMGQHYQGMGEFENEYYQDQLHLLVQLSIKSREMCMPNDELLEEAGHLYVDKFFGKVNDPVININYKVQQGYLALNKGDPVNASDLINDAFVQGASNKITIETQLKLLQAKGVIQTMRNGTYAGNFYFQKGLELCNVDNNFTVPSYQIKSLSNFEYLLGKNCLTSIQQNKSVMNQNQQLQELVQCQQFLTNAKEKHISLQKKNPVKLAHIYEALGDLCLLKEDHKSTRNYYEQANNLYIKFTEEIGKQQQIRMLEKLYKYYHQHSQNYTEQQKVKSLIQILKKRTQSVSTDHKKIFKRIRELKQQKKHRIFNIKYKDSIINQVDQLEEESAQHHSFSPSSSFHGQRKSARGDVLNNQQAHPFVQKQVI